VARVNITDFTTPAQFPPDSFNPPAGVSPQAGCMNPTAPKLIKKISLNIRTSRYEFALRELLPSTPESARTASRESVRWSVTRIQTSSVLVSVRLRSGATNLPLAMVSRLKSRLFCKSPTRCRARRCPPSRAID